ncbi:hypothetical protein LJC16_01095 [Bacteroidales bacterium OttesenSCG-928-C19]|nr:hypothetical protein [Bacteroidales bacterium OttesenSCG-928-C19]
MKKITFIFFFIFAILSIDCIAKKNIDSKLSPKQMKEDITFWYKTILETHPNPFQKLPPEQLDIKVQELITSLDKPLSQKDFWLQIAQFNQYFDGHTQIEFIRELFNSQNEWLFYLYYILDYKSSTLYFKDEFLFNGNSLGGFRIVSFNNTPISEIIQYTFKYTSIELLISSDFFISTMIGIYQNIYPIEDILEIGYEDANGEINHCSFNQNYVKNIIENSKNVTFKSEYPYKFQLFPEESIALIELNTCSKEWIKDEDFENFLSQTFREIDSSKIQNLFIDISANTGGSSSYVYQFLSYLISDTSSYLTTESIFKISPAIKKNRKFKEFTSQKNGTFYRKEWFITFPQTENTFQNNLFLIQSNSTYSAAVGLSSFINATKSGIIIGEETGGLTSGYIDSAVNTMKNSNIPFSCSTQAFSEIGSNKDSRGVIPDVEYKIPNTKKSFTLEELKKMLDLSKIREDIK